MIPVTNVGNPSMVARSPSSVPCNPLPNIINPMPMSKAQDARKSFHIFFSPNKRKTTYPRAWIPREERRRILAMFHTFTNPLLTEKLTEKRTVFSRRRHPYLRPDIRSRAKAQEATFREFSQSRPWPQCVGRHRKLRRIAPGLFRSNDVPEGDHAPVQWH